jgi:hypothetical protein
LYLLHYRLMRVFGWNPSTETVQALPYLRKNMLEF